MTPQLQQWDTTAYTRWLDTMTDAEREAFEREQRRLWETMPKPETEEF